MNLDELKCQLTLLQGGEGEVVGILRSLDQWVSEAGQGLDPHLRHYLQNRSYAKALDWILAQEGHPGT